MDDWNKYLFKKRGIIFDLDGVIALTEDVHREAFDFAFAGFGIDMCAYDWNRDFAGKGHRYIIDTVFGRSPDNDRHIDRWVYWYQRIAANKVKPVPGVIKYIKSVSFPMIVATGSARESAKIVLKSLKIDLPLVSMEDAPFPKPDPGLFLKASEIINVNPENCIVFEDSIYGIQAAQIAKMTVIALTTTHDEAICSRERPDLIIKDFMDKRLYNYL